MGLAAHCAYESHTAWLAARTMLPAASPWSRGLQIPMAARQHRYFTDGRLAALTLQLAYLRGTSNARLRCAPAVPGKQEVVGTMLPCYNSTESPIHAEHSGGSDEQRALARCAASSGSRRVGSAPYLSSRYCTARAGTQAGRLRRLPV